MKSLPVGWYPDDSAFIPDSRAGMEGEAIRFRIVLFSPLDHPINRSRKDGSIVTRIREADRERMVATADSGTG